MSFEQRIGEQRYAYDHLGNLTETTDDADGFFDRSLGTQTHGTSTEGPHQLTTASNRGIAPTSERQGDLETKFDAAGNLTDLLVRRDGPCLPSGASCWQRFHYGWDELGRLDIAKRWDLQGAERDDDLDEAPPARAAEVELRNTYDAGGSRVIKTAVDPAGNQSHTVYINSSYELRRTWWSDGDYVLTPETVTVYLPGGRVVYSEEDLPSLTSGKQHLFLQLSDYLGSSTATIDHETGELVEYSTFQPYGGIESDYRPARWGEFREPYKFTGKEEDVEVGLGYFGARFLVVGLNRWASTDPVTIHELRGDANPYAYVGGRPMVAVDPDGREFFTALAVGFVVGALIAGGTNAAMQYANTGQIDWGWDNGGVLQAAAIGGIAGAAGGGVGSLASGALNGMIGGSLGEGVTAFGTGVASGTAAGAAGYAAGVGFSGQQFSSGGFLKSTLMGAAVGGAFGLLNAASIGASEWSNYATRPSGGAAAARSTGAAVGEGIAVAAGQGALAFGFLKALGASNGVAAAGGLSAAANGGVAGARGTYNWSHPTGYLAAGLDATVGLAGTTISNVQGLTGIGSYVAEVSYRQNRMVFSGGAGFEDYAFTPGSTTVTNWSGNADLLNLHESVHLWQSRSFGPLFQAGTVAYAAGGFPVGFVGAAFTGQNVIDGAMAAGYASSPFERPAYGNQHYWPPGDRFPKGLLVW